jgi:hypothetical protein
MGKNPLQTPNKLQITVSIKKGKRNYANGEQLIAFLRDRFPEVSIALELYKLCCWENELQLLSETSVLITPCGGVSLSAIFLPHGASLIMVDYFIVQKNSSVGMKEKLWANLGYIRTFHYPFTAEEVQLPASLFPQLRRDQQKDMKDYGEIQINLEWKRL